jgi:hypothetical protein
MRRGARFREEEEEGVGEWESIQVSEKKWLPFFLLLFDVHALAPEISLCFTNLLYNTKTKG